CFIHRIPTSALALILLSRLLAPFSAHHRATPEFCTLSLHDALPISVFLIAKGPTLGDKGAGPLRAAAENLDTRQRELAAAVEARSEEHTSELQSLTNLVCRLLLEKKKNPTPDRHQPRGTRSTAPRTS